MPDFDQQRRRVDEQQAEQVNAVFQNQIAADLRDGLGAADQQNEAGTRPWRTRRAPAAFRRVPAAAAVRAPAPPRRWWPPRPAAATARSRCNGSISRSMFAARIARRSRCGNDQALHRHRAERDERRRASEILASISSGITPSTMPCSDIARISDGSRLLPSASRFNPIARPMSRFRCRSWRASFPRHQQRKQAQQKRRGQQQRHAAKREPRQQRFHQPHADRHRQNTDAASAPAAGERRQFANRQHRLGPAARQTSSSFTDAPCKIAASGGPLWSSTMTS